MFIPAFTTNAITSDFLSSITFGFVVMFLNSHLMVFTFCSLLDLLGVALAFRISFLKIFKLLPNYWHRVTDITSFEKYLERSSGHTLTFYLNLVKYRIKNMFWAESLLFLVLLQACTYYFLSVALLLTRRLGLYGGPCQNLLRGDRVLISVPSDC